MFKLKHYSLTLLAFYVVGTTAANFPGTSVDDPDSHGRLALIKGAKEKGSVLFSGIANKIHELGLKKESKYVKVLQDAGVDVSIVGDSITVSIPSVLFFIPGTTELYEGKKPMLDVLATFLKGQSRGKIAIHGFSDRLGSKKHQSVYAEDTARAIQAAFWVNGIAMEDMTVQSHGSKFMVSQQGDNLYNARVEIRIQT